MRKLKQEEVKEFAQDSTNGTNGTNGNRIPAQIVCV